MSSSSPLSAVFLSLLSILTASTDDKAAIVARTDATRVNVNYNVTNHKTFNESAAPNPDITILSQDYFLCIWSYVVKDESEPNQITFSNEIYSNIFSTSTGTKMVRQEFLLNHHRGYSQDTPSATALFNTSNLLTHTVAVVWESQIEDPLTGNITDAVYGRIIRWRITYNDRYRYVRVTSPTSQEFQVSSTSLYTLHHRNPDVIPIYNTGKFLVSWISSTVDGTANMIFIRIYYNSGIPYSDEIEVHDKDAFYKKHVRAVPLLHNLTLLSWLSQAMQSDSNNELIVYGMIVDANGVSKLDTSVDFGRYVFVEMNDDFNHSIYHETVPVIAHLHNDPHRNNNYFIVGWQAVNEETNTMYAALYVYDDDTNTIRNISALTPLFDPPYFKNDEYKLQHPELENIGNEVYELENGLDAKIALCYSLKDLEWQKTDIFCKVLEVTLWDNEQTIVGEIDVITEDKPINPEAIGMHHHHEYPQISSESSLRAQADFSDTPQFQVVWSNQRVGGYDIYTRIMKFSEDGEVASNDDDEDSKNNSTDAAVFGSLLNKVVFGVVLAIVLVVIGVGVVYCVIMRQKETQRTRPQKIQQLGEESEDEDDDDHEDTIGQRYGTETGGAANEVLPDYDDVLQDEDGVQMTERDTFR
mmetsp:Transcript_6761/g.11106  ORF Transcript_6761/g.11106 Transcript_6761/m.11106 type:complete len:641 (+) Transcript_6761:541-2463(+)